MKTYVVSYMDFFNNDLLSTVVRSENETDALLRGIYLLQCESLGLPPQDDGYKSDEFLSSFTSEMSVADIKDALFDGDAVCNIIKIES